MEVRLQKYLASAGVASRRKSEELILDGRVSVNGKIVTELGTKIETNRDKVAVDNKLIKTENRKRYNKDCSEGIKKVCKSWNKDKNFIYAYENDAAKEFWFR